MTNHYHHNYPPLLPVRAAQARPDGICDPPAEWMPLDEIVAAWSAFGARTHDAQGWLAVSSAFAALATETEAYQHTAVLLSHANRTPASQHAASAAISALADVLARWHMALLWLDHVRHHPMVPDEDEDTATQTSELESRSRWHLLRVSRLQARLREEWIVQALWPSCDGEQEHEEATS